MDILLLGDDVLKIEWVRLRYQDWIDRYHSLEETILKILSKALQKETNFWIIFLIPVCFFSVPGAPIRGISEVAHFKQKCEYSVNICLKIWINESECEKVLFSVTLEIREVWRPVPIYLRAQSGGWVSQI